MVAESRVAESRVASGLCRDVHSVIHSKLLLVGSLQKLADMFFQLEVFSWFASVWKESPNKKKSQIQSKMVTSLNSSK